MNWKSGSKLVLQVLTFPFWLLLIQIPNLIDGLIFKYQNRNFRLTRPNCVFLINSLSGKKLGPKIFAITEKLGRGRIAFDILKDDYIAAIRAILVDNGELLHVIVCGGDGTVNSVIDKFEDAFEEQLRDRLIYIPMALGTGNDMSRSLNISDKVNINFMNSFFQRVDSPRTSVRLVDRWQCRVFSENTQQVLLNKSFLLYLGVGYDAETTVFFERFRRQTPWMFRVNVSLEESQQALLRIYLRLPAAAQSARSTAQQSAGWDCALHQKQHDGSWRVWQCAGDELLQSRVGH